MVVVRRSQVKKALAVLAEGLERPLLAIDPDLLQQKCILLLTSGRYEETRVIARLLVENHPERPDGHFFLGQVMGNLGELEKSLVEHQRSVELAPRNVYYHLQLGIAFRRLNRNQKACSVLRTAKRLDPKNLTVRYNLAQVLMALGRKSQAQVEMDYYLRLQAFQKKR